MKRKSGWGVISSVAVAVTVAALSACSFAEPEITGHVEDNFNRPLAGAIAVVRGSNFSATTDSDGNFKLRYAPGEFVVDISAGGHTSTAIGLNISSPTSYPLADTMLILVPPSTGLWLVGTDAYVPLAQVAVDSATTNAGFMTDRIDYVVTPSIDWLDQISALNVELAKIPPDATQVTIVDSTSGKWLPIRLAENRVGSIVSSTFGADREVQEINEDVTSLAGLTFHRLQLPVARLFEEDVVCMVQLAENMMFQNVIVADGKSAYCLPGSEVATKRLATLSHTARPAPQFRLATLPEIGVDGFEVSELVGEVTVVSVFATWCIPCRDQVPLLEALRQKSGVRIFAIVENDEPQNVAKFLDELGNPYDRIGHDADESASDVLGITGVPEIFVVDAKGIVTYRFLGPLTAAAIDGELLPAIQQARAN